MYADYNDQHNQTLVNILGTFLRQFLTTTQERIPDEVIQTLHNIQLKGEKVQVEDTLALLKPQLQKLKHAFLCIDAVDELHPEVRRQLLNLLLKELNTENIRLFLTGRDHVEGEIKKRFQILEGNKVVISATQHDIQEFVRQKIQDDHDLNPEAMDDVLAQDIEAALTKKSQGM